MLTSLCSSLRLPGRLVIAICLLLGVASAGTKTVPCATDSHGKAVVFNGGNGNPYDCTITITTNANGTEDIRINQPVVGSEARNGFRYEAISFSPGDLITITADGCVQTSGSGSTWKKYVNPQGSNSGPHVNNGLYFGTITIGGGVTAHGPLEDRALDDLGAAQGNHAAQIYVDVIQKIPGRPNPQVLTLGYKDDDYDDHGGNGYWGHDDGNNDQCANTAPNAPFGSFGGSAFVRLHVVHNAKNPFGPSVARQWDLVPHGLDINGLPLNPEWGWQVNGGTIAKDGVWDASCLAHGCSSQDPQLDQASLTATNWPSHLFANVCNFDTGPSGHHNWFDVTYTGTVRWVEHSGGAFGDDDYNMAINTPIFHFEPPGQTSIGFGAGTSFFNTTSGNAFGEDSIGLEFDSDETIDHFDQNQFWHTFHQTVDNGSDQDVDNLMDNHDVVVIGLIGFDEMHDGHTEIHPVHALAIREGSPQPLVANTLDPAHDRWFFFVRNWGDEGECSRYQHYLQTDTITLEIPPPVLAIANPPHFATATLNKNASQVLGTGTDNIVHFFSGKEGTFVTFKLSDAVTQPFAFGEFELSWKAAAGSPGSPGPHRAPLKRIARPRERETTRVEQRLNTIWKGATPEQRQLFHTLVTSISPARHAIVSKALNFEVLAAAPRRAVKAPAVTVGPATEKMQRDAARLQAMCAATGGKLPSQPSWCSEAKVPPVSILTTTGGAQGTPVTATLTVYDASGRGLGPVQYSLDGKTWKTYTGPFTLPAGTSTVYHRARDKEDNLEEIRKHSVTTGAVTPAAAPAKPD